MPPVKGLLAARAVGSGVGQECAILAAEALALPPGQDISILSCWELSVLWRPHWGGLARQLASDLCGISRTILPESPASQEEEGVR